MPIAQHFQLHPLLSLLWSMIRIATATLRVSFLMLECGGVGKIRRLCGLRCRGGFGAFLGGGAVDDDAGGFVGGEKIRRGGAEKGGKAVQAGVHGAEFVEEVFQGEGADAALDGGGAG